MAAPATYQQLREALQARLDTLAAGQRRVAELVLDDPEGTAFRTVTQTAELAGVHASSVVRFATALGLSGYPALVALCREHLAREAQLVSRFRLAQQHATPDELLAATVAHEQRNLLRTVTRLDRGDWDRAVRLLATAPRVHVVGLRKCLPVAQLTSYLLRLVRPDVHQLAPVAGGLVDELRELASGDAFVAFGIHRYTAETVRALREARRRGLHTVAFTDRPGSPLARLADLAFLVDCEGVTLLRSVTPFVALAQALATAVALHNGARSREELLEDEQLLSDFAVYTD